MRILKRILIGIAAAVLVPWFGCALMVAIETRSASGFIYGLIVVAQGAAESADRVLFPHDETRFPVRQCSCNAVVFQLAGARWSELEVRMRGESTYVGWTRGTPPEATAFAIVNSSNGLDSHRIGQEDWNSATPLRTPETTAGVSVQGTYVTVQGKKFQPFSGGVRTAAVTPDGTKLAVWTLDGPHRPSGLYFFDPFRSAWGLYLEVWRIDSGEKLLQQETRFKQGHPVQPMRLTWATNRLLVASRHPDRSSIEACFFTEPHEIREYRDGQISLEALSADASEAKVTIRPIDGDGNGRFDALEIIANLTVRKPGTYSFHADLSSGQEPVASPQIRRFLEAGSQTLSVFVEAEDFQNARRRGPFMIAGLEISGPEGGVARSQDRVALAELGTPEDMPFRLTGEWGIEPMSSGFPPKLTALSGRVGCVSPGGRCHWTGEIVQGNQRFALSGEQHTQPGDCEIPWRIHSHALAGVRIEQPLELRLISLNCNGRALRARGGEPYLATYSLDIPVIPEGP